MGGYDTAQYCRSGHLITQQYGDEMEQRQSFCSVCGSATLAECEECHTSILGAYSANQFNFYPSPRPNYCRGCGHAHPWLAERLAAAKDLIATEGQLSADDRQQIAQSLSDIASDGPRTELAVIRVKRLVQEAGTTVGDALYRIAIDLASETAKRLLVP